MSAVIEQLLNGLTIGIVYVLVASGLSIIFGVMDVINFAHGELFALGAYFALTVVGLSFLGGSAFWVAILVVPVFVGAIGMAIEYTTIRPLYDRNPLYHILLTFGIVLVLNDLIELYWGTQQQYFSPPGMFDQQLTILGFSYPSYNYFMLAFGAVVAVGAWAALAYTKFGLIVRAGAEDREMVLNLGIDVDRYYTLVFGFGAALAGLAGIVLGAYQVVQPTMGSTIIIPAFVIVVLGGLGSFKGAVVGGLAVGLLQTFSRIYVPQLEGLLLFSLMILVLLVRPQGLFGHPEGETAGQEAKLIAGGRRSLLTDSQRFRLGSTAIGALALMPLGVGTLYTSFYLPLFSLILIWGLFALSLDLVMGYAGLVSLGHAMFYGLGAYATVLVLLHVTSSVIVALGAAILVCAVLAYLVGHLSIRISKVYFAMVTLAFAELFRKLAVKIEFVGRSDGLYGFSEPLYGIAGVGFHLEDISLGNGLEVTSDALYYYLLLALLVVVYLAVQQMMRAPFGSVLRAIRESDRRASFVGYNTTVYKRQAFVVSGMIAGLSGGLFALLNEFVSPTLLHWSVSGEVLIITMLGGMGTLWGPITGAGVFLYLKDFLTSTQLVGEQWGLVLGTLFILFVIFVPEGIASLPQTVSEYVEQRVDGRRTEQATEAEQR